MKKISTLTIIALTICIQAWSQCIPNSSSLTFNGTSSYANVPVNPLLVITDSITIEAWINAAAFTTGPTPSSNSIVCKHGWGYGEQGYVLRTGSSGAGGALSFNFAGVDTNGSYASWQSVLSTSVMNANTWYHVAGTYDGDTLKCYINGNLEGTFAFKGTIRDSSAYDLKIGRLAYTSIGQTRYFNGKIDEVRIWNRALSQSELSASMNTHIDPTIQTGLVGYWRFNENSGTAINDLSGNNLNGTVTSTTWSTSVPFNTPVPTANLSYSAGQLSVTPPAVHYQWYLNGFPLPNDTLQSWHPTQNGQYYVVVTGSNGCTAFSGTLNLTNVGIKEQEASNTISILNNPADDLVTIQLSENMLAYKIELYDVSGKNIAAFENVFANYYSLSCNGFNEGMYLIRINTNKGIFIRKLVIARK